MTLRAITPREASIFACLTEAICAPDSDFPAVAETTAVKFYDDYLACSPRANGLILRTMVLASELGPLALGYRARLRRLDATARTRYVSKLSTSSLAPVHAAFKIVKSIANTAYYSDDRVLKGCGYDADANVARARALREKEGRP